MQSLVAELEKLLVKKFLSPKALVQFEQGRIAQAELEQWIEPIRRISEGYNSNSALSIDSERMAHAYALYFTLINFSKLEFLLAHLPSTFTAQSLRVLDFGCGPGTASLALKSAPLTISELVLMDASPSMIKIAGFLIEEFLGGIPLVQHDAQKSYDLILAANVLNEIPEDKIKPTLNELLEWLAPEGALVLLEPALKPATHRAMRARDYLLAQDRALNPLFPCTRRDACPMLQREPDNWCHGTLRWEEPRLTQQLDELLGFNKHRIKYCGFVFQRGAQMLNGKRILGDPVKRKHGTEVLVCGPDAYGTEIVKKITRQELAQWGY
jgi:ribosomal protein RSM22 (predicted rRNA methylase)